MSKQIPDRVICAWCKRPLDPYVYSVTLDEDTLEEDIIRIGDPNIPAFSVQCTCGKYTVYRPK